MTVSRKFKDIPLRWWKYIFDGKTWWRTPLCIDFRHRDKGLGYWEYFDLIKRCWARYNPTNQDPNNPSNIWT